MNIIKVKELWDDPSGDYCSDVSIDGRNVASFYSRESERVFLGAIRDKHCTVERDYSRVLRAAKKRLTAA